MASRARAIGALLILGDRHAAMRVKAALERVNGNVRLAARLAGVGERTLHRWLSFPILADAPRRGRARDVSDGGIVTKTDLARALRIPTHQVTRLAAATGVAPTRKVICGRRTLVFTDADVERLLAEYHYRRGRRINKRQWRAMESHAD